jgi:hypothetical protein
MAQRSAVRASKPDGALDREVQARIGLELRAMYDEVVKQGVPDRFAELLQRLDKQDERSK